MKSLYVYGCLEGSHASDFSPPTRIQVPLGKKPAALILKRKHPIRNLWNLWSMQDTKFVGFIDKNPKPSEICVFKASSFSTTG